MNTVIKYKNNRGTFVTQQQSMLLKDYSKLYFIDHELKKEEKFLDRIPLNGLYYLNNSENPLSIVNQLNPNFSWTFLTKTILNGYSIFESKAFDSSLQLKPKYYKKVFNTNEKHIATIMFDSQTNTPLGGIKIFRFWEDEEILFNFNDEGIVRKISISNMILSNEMTYYDLSGFLDEIDEFVGDIITQEQLDYFTNLEPLVPDFY